MASLTHCWPIQHLGFAVPCGSTKNEPSLQRPRSRSAISGFRSPWAHRWYLFFYLILSQFLRVNMSKSSIHVAHFTCHGFSPYRAPNISNMIICRAWDFVRSWQHQLDGPNMLPYVAKYPVSTRTSMDWCVCFSRILALGPIGFVSANFGSNTTRWFYPMCYMMFDPRHCVCDIAGYIYIYNSTYRMSCVCIYLYIYIYIYIYVCVYAFKIIQICWC